MQKVQGPNGPLALAGIRAAREAAAKATTGPLDPEELVRTLRDVDMGGGGSANSFAVGHWATIAPTTLKPGQTGGLLEAYLRFKALEERSTAKARAERGPSAEGAALRKSKRRVAKKVRKGKSAASAVAAGHDRYRALGGTLDYAEWTREVAR